MRPCPASPLPDVRHRRGQGAGLGVACAGGSRPTRVVRHVAAHHAARNAVRGQQDDACAVVRSLWAVSARPACSRSGRSGPGPRCSAGARGVRAGRPRPKRVPRSPPRTHPGPPTGTRPSCAGSPSPAARAGPCCGGHPRGRPHVHRDRVVRRVPAGQSRQPPRGTGHGAPGRPGRRPLDARRPVRLTDTVGRVHQRTAWPAMTRRA